ncbi:MAG TPA: Ada metal-binding domain-containing protein [Candidatus Paceibacterota bacterium]|nr:Ada metal-binding domain-containing protein [Candidatus Paceibacterota bacterium]
MSGVTIQDFVVRCKVLLEVGISQYGLIILVFLVAFGAFGLGRLSVFETVQPVLSVETAPVATAILALPPGGYVVASKTGSVYYLPWCSGAQKIAVGNQVWFSSEKDAQAAGYTPSKSCKGLGAE